MNKKNGPPIVHGGENFHVWQEPTNRFVSKTGVHLTSTYILKSLVKKESIQHISLIHDVPIDFPYFTEGIDQYGVFEQPYDDKESTREDLDSVREQTISKPIKTDVCGNHYPSIYKINDLLFAIDSKIEYIQKTNTFDSAGFRYYRIKSHRVFIPQEKFTEAIFVHGIQTDSNL